MDDGELAGLVRAYMRDNPGRRAQFDALVHCLYANGRDRALQVLLGVARRHKMAGIQATAAALVRQIASERGWSAEELADRTVPTTGSPVKGFMSCRVHTSGRPAKASGSRAGSEDYTRIMGAEDLCLAFYLRWFW